MHGARNLDLRGNAWCYLLEGNICFLSRLVSMILAHCNPHELPQRLLSGALDRLCSSIRECYIYIYIIILDDLRMCECQKTGDVLPGLSISFLSSTDEGKGIEYVHD
jgi:hypothetical protein